MAGVADQFEQHVIKMTALGRKFYLGDHYDYRTDQVMKGDGCWESSKIISVTKVETNFKFQCIISISDSDKRDHIGLDDHSKVSTITGLIGRCRGASTYLNDRKKPGEVTQTVKFRIKSRKEYLELATLLNVPKTDRKETSGNKSKEGTHVVVGIVYGAEAYCVLTKDLLGQTDEDAREEAKVDLDSWAEKMQSGIEENQDLIQFKEQFDKEERTKLTRMKCRLYLDIQTPTFRECNYFEAYQHCVKLIEKIRKTDRKIKTVPISFKLCPLNVIKNITGNEFQEIESTLIERCCRALDKLEFICDKAEVVRKLTSKKLQRDSLRDFQIQVEKYIGYVRNSLKECIVRFRSDGDENAVEKVIQRIENHSIFKPSRLKRWLSYKSSELEMTKEIANLTEISFLPTASQLKNELSESLNKKYSLVFQIPALDQETNQILETMKNYFDTYIKLVEVDEDENNDVEFDFPWHMIERKRNQVLDKIKEFSNYIAKNTSSIENQVQFLLTQVESGQKLDFQYSLYENDCFLKGFNQLPDCPPTALRVYLLPTKNQSSFRLEWDHEDLGYPIQYFIIEHRPKDSTEVWIQQKTTNFNQHDVTIQCKPDVVTEFRVAVSTCVGRSEFSDLINTQLALSAVQTDELSHGIEINHFKTTQLLQVPDMQKLPAAITNAGLEQNVKISDLNSVFECNEKKEGKDETHGNQIETGAVAKFQNDSRQKIPETFNYDKRYQQIQKQKSLANRRIAEIFVKDNTVSQLIKKGKPNVYWLNAENKSISTEFRWFNVANSKDKSSLPQPKHKVIILMGATGCGKSKLINGMVNYILGVQWNDPFRFKVVREDDAASWNRTHSQTSSVTAYTLEHQDGMTVPYSITIIDTPGYGDSRGVQRDKEITRDIHQFLSQMDTEINEIHAVCFVAASSDSRLTATQRYIIDSVLSTFGKNIKDSIRLLVTFADNDIPPVVEACKVAHFPVTSQSADIIYSKFNSLVLYASNKLQDGDFSFDKFFWDMGQENFHKFFTMLEAMDGCDIDIDLRLTREVIRNRQQAESLKITENIAHCKLENGMKMDSITLRTDTLLKNPVLKKIPQMEKILCDFQDLINLLWIKIETYHDFSLPNSPDQLHPQFTYLSGLLEEIEEWLDKIGRQIALLSWLLHEVKLNIMNWSELESRAPSLQEKFARVFVLKISWVPDQLMEKIKKLVSRMEVLNVSTFPEFMINDRSKHATRDKLVEFELEANLSRHLSHISPGIGYYIGLANKFELNNGDIKTIEYRTPINQALRKTHY